MQRIQARYVLILAGLVLGGCGAPETEVLTTSQYLHDIDAARAQLKKAKAGSAGETADPATLNASAAVAKAMAPSMLECWPVKPASTATTDHGCLDRKGFRR